MSLYIPKRFELNETQKAFEIMRAFPFATVITASPELRISQLPLVTELRGDQFVLVGHLARANPHWKVLSGGEVTILFHGPNAYITPTWYAEHDVPTWNYLTVQASGAARLIEDEAGITAALKKLTEAMEPADGWQFGIPDDLSGALNKAIVAFEIPVTSWNLKAKLGQNRSRADLAGVIDGLAGRSDDGSRQIRDWMRSLL